ncbi:borealin isoform X2 [Aedes aegypti]|uniref:Borealin C-terminal domain-containing protein n=1 Tax=Aedes aegypti TaxID=7159 RepID=A0A6I8TKU9_AEDAE|nr:borealin isoform X2 [Aedes aegypti]
MVRPKTSRNGNSKRNRTSYQEEKVNAKLRDYDILADSLVANLESIFNDKLEELSLAFKMEKTRFPKHVLQMRMGDLRLIGASTFADLDKITLEPPACDGMSSLGSSQLSSSYNTGSKGEKKQSRADEEDSATSNRNSDLLSSAKGRPYGPLASAMKNRRRSKSVSSNSTPSKHHSSVLFGIKSKKTFGGSQSLFAESNRLSRSKFRTPVPGSRLKQTVSADRGMTMITPKVQPNTPMAIMRHARLGESIYSITGSPVITAAMVEEMANVNIPIQNGILSLRPTEMDSIDTGLVQKIDSDTLEHLKKLQMNLNKIMQMAEGNNFQQM